MARKNSQVEHLQYMNDILRKQIDNMSKDPGDIPFVACDNSCIVARPTGMTTNGGCRCEKTTLRRAVMWWRRRAEFLQITIQDMRNGKEIDKNEEDILSNI